VTQTLVAEGQGRWQEYVGGYSDWLAYRQARTLASATRSKAESKPAAAREAPAAKMSYKETRELEQLPQQIEVLEKAQRELVEKMSGVDYHRQGAVQMKADSEQAADIERQLAKKFDRWAVLDAKAGAGR
jgi:ATP-binding cassette subfamily F protein uup